MGYSPEYLAKRRRDRTRRRRALAAVAVIVIAGAAAAGVLLIAGSHRVVVVRVAPSARAGRDATRSGSGSGGEYPAAPGAQSLQSVRSALAAARHAGSASGSTSQAQTGESPLLAGDASGSFEQLAASLPGRVELALAPLGAGPREVLGGDEAAHGWSTTKVPVLVALLRARGGEGLTAQEQSWAQSAITESNNESVLALFADLERLEGGLTGASRYIEGLLRDSGDEQTAVATAPPPPGAVTTFGQTEWSPGEAVRFFRALALGCLLPPDATGYVLGLMQQIEPSESWGLGSAGFDSIAFKGGWGPEADGYLVRQSGIVDPGSPRGAVVAIVAFAPSFAAGTEMLTRTATWLHEHLRLTSRPQSGCQQE